MFIKRSLFAVLAAGGMFVSTQSAGAVIVVQDDIMVNGGNNLNAGEWSEYNGAFVSQGFDHCGDNVFLIFNKNNAQNAGQGFFYHVPVADVIAVQPLQDGMAIRTSAWFHSDPDNPWATQSYQGYMTEFYNVALGEFFTPDMTNETNGGMGYGLVDATGPAVTTGWTQTSATFVINDVDVDFASLQEFRPGLVTSDWTGSDTDGRLFVDGFTFEVFPDLATANATALPSNEPVSDIPDLPGDLDDDGFVGITDLNIVLSNWNQTVPPANPAADPSGDNFIGIEDLNIVLGNWNAGTPPNESANIPEPATLMLLGVPLFVFCRWFGHSNLR